MRIIYILILLFTTNFIIAQNVSYERTVEKLEEDYQKIRNTHESTEEVIIELNRLKVAFSEINYKEGILKCNAKLMTNYLKRADYNSALKLVDETEKLAKQLKDYKSLSTLYARTAVINHSVGHYELELEESKKSLYYANKITDKNDRFYQLGFSSFQLSCYFKNNNNDSILYYLKQALHYFQQIDSSSEMAERNVKDGALMAVYMDLGNFYGEIQKPFNLNEAEQFLLKAYEFKETNPKAYEYYDLPLTNSLGNFYIRKGEAEKAILFSKEALELERKEKRPDERIKSYMNLAKAYKMLNQTELQLDYTNKYSQLSDSISLVEKNTHEQKLKRAIAAAADKANKEKNYKFFNNIYITSILLILSVPVLLVVWWRIWFKKKLLLFKKTPQTLSNSEDIIVFNEIQSLEKTNNNGVINIPDETIKGLLKKLEKFEQSEKYLKNEINLTWLANHLNTNPKYLSEIINRFKEKKFNSYINGLRITYIKDKLKENPAYRNYKISYLAQECGYSSPQVFVIAFKKETGIPPSSYIEALNNDNNNT